MCIALCVNAQRLCNISTEACECGEKVFIFLVGIYWKIILLIGRAHRNRARPSAPKCEGEEK